MRSAFWVLLIGCSPADPMAARAEHAALACYDNGTLVYASETTVDDLGEVDCATRFKVQPTCNSNRCWFTDKGVDFATDSLHCVARTPDDCRRAKEAKDTQRNNEILKEFGIEPEPSP